MQQGGKAMKAIVCSRYGSPDVLQLTEVETPAPKSNEALVKIVATSVNAADLEILRGDFAVRIAAPLRPRYKILGSDVAGRVEAVGSNVTRFRPDDEIWGDLSMPLSYGTFAEYVCIPEHALRLKPAGMTFEQAAAVPTAGVVALQHFRCKRPIEPGQRVLINGAGGSVGTFAVQLAKHFGAEVTGVDSAAKLDMLRSIGADHVIDYSRVDFTATGQRYDLVLDVVASRSVSAYRRALDPDGICLLVGGSMLRVFQALLLAPLVSRAGNQRIGLAMWEPNNKEDLADLAELFAAGKMTPIIDGRYPLHEVPEAFRRLASGQHKGKIVITV
jgi:NADPH:quinone reductase-like Zn-dependent oxidoreductase